MLKKASVSQPGHYDLGAGPSSAGVGSVLHAVEYPAASLASSPQVVTPKKSADITLCPWGGSGTKLLGFHRLPGWREPHRSLETKTHRAKFLNLPTTDILVQVTFVEGAALCFLAVYWSA